MKLIRYEYIAIIIGIFALIFFSLSIFFASKEWSFARSYGSHVVPTNWLGYYSELKFRETYSKIIRNNKPGLPTKYLYVSKNNLDKLLSNFPDSTKKWQDGFIFENGEMKKISLRYLGDNLNNWIFENKSFKLKYTKKNFGTKYRSFDYFTPRINPDNEFEFTRVISHYLLEKFGNITPKVRMVEIRMNGENKGIYLEIPKLDELFLRQNNFMPVNIYKGENNNREVKIGIDINLFNNPSLWSKISVFNQTDINDKNDLKYFLKLLVDFQKNLISPDFFFSKIPPDVWAKFLISGASDHGGNNQNQRLLSDPWTGYYYPLPVDSAFNINNLFEHNIDRNFFNYRDRVLNSDPYFILRKYSIYYDEIFVKKVLLELVDYFEKLKSKLINSAERDYHYIRNIYEKKIKREKINLLKNNNNFSEELEKLILNLKKATENKNDFTGNIKANWSFKDSNLFFTLRDKLPSGNILIKLQEGQLFEDIEINLKNTNNFFKTQKIPYEIKNDNELVLKLSLVADRIFSHSNHIGTTNSKIKPTLFKFEFNKDLKIKDVYVQNIFTNNFGLIKNSHQVGLIKSNKNYAIIDQIENIIKLSGDIYINETKIFKEKVLIKPGTNIFLKKGTSLIFKNKLIANGTKLNPINIKQSENNNYWGSILLLGSKTKHSELKNVNFEGGSGGWIENIRSIGMLSIHNSEDIVMENISLKNNSIYDDTMHIVYSKNIKIKNLKMTEINSDGIDIDISKNIEIDNISINSAKNDCLDFMQSIAIIKNSFFQNCKDKGISVGENSNIRILESTFSENNIAIESKDRSFVDIKDSKLSLNKLVFSAYKKNWKYNGGGIIKSKNNEIKNNKNTLSEDKHSSITIN